MKNILKEWSVERIQQEINAQKRHCDPLWEKRVELLESELKKRK